MNLNREGVARVENFEEEREPVRVRSAFTKESEAQAGIGPELRQTASVERSTEDPAVRFLARRNLPGFPKRQLQIWQVPTETLSEEPPAPNSRLINRFESNKGVRRGGHAAGQSEKDTLMGRTFPSLPS